MADPALFTINPAGETKRKILHNSRKGNIGHLDYKMKVVSHETKSVYPMVISTDTFLQ
jgi:hypothetical protein